MWAFFVALRVPISGQVDLSPTGQAKVVRFSFK
jgi:hypothetical protein